jgi:hypothetical protein
MTAKFYQIGRGIGTKGKIRGQGHNSLSNEKFTQSTILVKSCQPMSENIKCLAKSPCLICRCLATLLHSWIII